MDPIVLTAEEEEFMHEGIRLRLSMWPAMQLAVDNGWGGRAAREKFESTISELLDFFIQTKVYPPDEDKLYDLLREGLLGLNTVAEESSIDDVKDLYDDCGNYQKALEKLRTEKSQTSAFRAVKVSNGNDDESSDDEDEDEDTCMEDDQTTDMMVDHCSNQKPDDEPKADDGWTLVSCKKNKAKKNSMV